DALEGRRLDALDGHGLAAEGHCLPHRALRGERAQLAHGELAFLENPERRLPGGAGGADHGDGESGRHQYCRSTSFTIRLPISRVPFGFTPAAMSAVRWPASSTRSTAWSIRSASFSMLSEYRRSIAAERIAAIGVAMPCPAMSRAVPCPGAERPTVPPSDAEGSMPIEPARIAASSDKISPKVFSVTIVSNCVGRCTRAIAQLSTSTWSSVTSGYSWPTRVTTSRQSCETTSTFT